MPKKRTLNLKRIQQSHASSASGSPCNSHGAPASDSPATVNERLSELRQVETPEILQKKRDLAASVGLASVPPELRGILGVPETAPPKPKVGVRLRERMRTPGPAPPRSWLGYRAEWQPALVMRGGKEKKRSADTAALVERNRPTQLLRFDRLLKGEQHVSEKKVPSLLYLSLKRLAQQWHLFDEEDFPALVELPLRLRLQLVSYLGSYGSPIDTAGLQALTAGDEPVTHLDLAGLAGHAPLTLKKLGKLFEVQVDVLKSFLEAEHLARVDRRLLRPYIQLRSDYDRYPKKTFDQVFGESTEKSTLGRIADSVTIIR